MAVMRRAPSRRLGRYELISYLGSGGMSDVYVALHVGLRKRVALKLLHPSLRCDEDAVRRFLSEGECAARVRHPNVVDVCDIGMHEGVPYLVMELLDGETLAQKLSREGPLPVESAVDLLLPILDAIAAVHAAGVLHRDIKPANILLSRVADGSVLPKLVDFGIALLPGQAPDQAPELGPLGTPHYMAPEQARGEEMDERSDQYAIMSVLYEMLTGRPPFVGDSVEAVLVQVARGKFPRVTGTQQVLPGELQEVIARATARRASHRYASVHELAHALVPFASPRTRSLWRSRDARFAVVGTPLFSGTYRAAPHEEVTLVASSSTTLACSRVRRLAATASLRVFGGFALLGLGLIAGLGVTSSELAAPRRPLAPAAAPSPAPSAPETFGSLLLPAHAALAAHVRHPQLRLVPRDALVELDGVPLGRGEVELPDLGHDLHELRISAPGHVARVVLFRGMLADGTIQLDPEGR